MTQAKNIAKRAWQCLKRAASSVLDAIAGPTRGAHSAAANEGRKAPAQSAGAHSAKSARTARVTRSHSTRGAHTLRSRAPRVVSARGAHSARTPRATIPCSLQTAPAAARGYSMAEVLATVAIIVILASLVVVNVVSFQANLRQKELDAKAEIIYTAAQEQMTRIMASGWEGVFKAPDRTPDSNAGEGTSTPVNGSSMNSSSSINGSAYPATDAGVSFIPSDYALPGAIDENNPIEQWQICYITSNDVGKSGYAADLLFGEGGLDDELSNGNWVIEFDYKTLTVYSVYYSEGTYNCAGDSGYAANFASYNTTLRGWNGRLDSESVLGRGNHVGYHGGGSTGSDAEFKLAPKITVANEEKLTVDISCSKPLISQHLEFLVTLSDDYNHSYTALYKIWDSTTTTGQEGSNTYVYDTIGTPVSPVNGRGGATFSNLGQRYTLKLTLDSLEEDGLRFTKLYGAASKEAEQTSLLENGTGNDALVEGSNIHISVVARCPSNGLITQGSDEYTTNSLFSDDVDTTGGPQTVTAHIKYGRHLQNLDGSSGIGTAATSPLRVTAAELDESIDFEDNDNSDGRFDAWKATYGSKYFNDESSAGNPCFKPIANAALASIDGQRSTLAHLNVDVDGSKNKGDGNAGLLASISGKAELKNITLTGASVSGIASAGTLVGELSSKADVKIENCRVFLEHPGDTDGKTESTLLVKSNGGNGGLVGFNAGKLEITGSSASTVIGGGSAGGLVGANNSALVVSTSYADCYLTGISVGGLVGSGSGSSAVDNSYAAGFFGNSHLVSEGTSAAGLVNGTASLTKTYTLCALVPNNAVAFGEYFTTSRSDAVTSAYYLDSSIVGQKEYGAKITDSNDLFTKLGRTAPFTMDERSKSQAYNLMGQGLGTYEWPTIAGLNHYGDWAVAGFQPGSLVYFEEYQIGDDPDPVFGFEGGNVPKTLLDVGKNADNNKVTVVGDGYGVVYGSEEEPDVTVTVTNPKDGSAVGTVDINKSSQRYIVGDYAVYPLGNEIANTYNANPGYFLSAQLEDKRQDPSTFSYYYFNPHFARTVVQVNSLSEEAALGKYISVRTARQLFNLSLHYETYSDKTRDCTFTQERNIAFKEYLWPEYLPNDMAYWGSASLGPDNYGKGRIYMQEPIGSSSGNHAFQASYDGGCHEITDVSFFSESGRYVGMFGYVASGAKVRNVVLCTDYDPNSDANYRVQRNKNVTTTSTVSMGVLAGYNEGAMSNCAIAGYYLSGPEGTILAYSNSSMDVGGLVGTNAGTIKNCAADTPKLRLSLLDSRTRAGGLVGYNKSEISNSYALGVIEVLSSKGGSSAMAGFAGGNDGAITNCYCATAIAVSGEGTESYGFAPAGGAVSLCTYLHGGTYSYIGRMYAYNFDTSNGHTSGTNIKYDELKVKEGSSRFVSVANTFMHSQTNTTTGHYPFAGRVKNASGQYVHYGNWQDDVLLGTLGIFYWEEEEDSGNAGYHMTYLGSYEDSSVGAAKRHKVAGGSSLCTSHDDGGVIKQYGYGFYVQQGQENKVTAQWDQINCSGSGLLDEIGYNAVNQDASRALKEQLESTETGSDRKFTFYAYTTNTAEDVNDYISLNGGAGENAKQNGTLKLTFDGDAGAVVYDFTLSPFFANALSFDKINDKAVDDASVIGSDNAVTDCTEKPGFGESNPYEVRSLQQLQYVNWNAAIRKTDVLTKKDNYKDYPYLQFATNIKDDGTYNGPSQTRPAAEQARRPQNWLQTHDVVGTGGSIFAPIAGAATSSTTGYNARLYTWFGGSYDGQSYTVKNAKIQSKSFYTGLFAVTAGAAIQNVIMYGTDGNAVVERKTEGKDGQGAYAIGSLVGVAFNYADETAGKAENVIKNCAVSGYQVIDRSGNQQGLGEVCIGGLIGVANVNLQKCSAVTDIKVEPTINGKATWGNFFRVGGLVGGLLDTIENCYSGGTITVAQGVLDATYSGSKQIKRDSRSVAKSQDSTHVYLAGIAASAFASTFDNFNSNNDGTMVVKNSYTYMRFPKMEGTIRAISMIGSLADRHSRGNSPTFTNCYYYSKSAEDIEYDFPSYTFEGGSGSLSQYLNTPAGKDYTKDMLEGDVRYLFYYLGENTNNGAKPGGVPVAQGSTVTSKTYDKMCVPDFTGLLNGSSGPWHQGASTEDAAEMPIPGKYSFPSSPALTGKDYPFPAVVTQRDLTFDNANVFVHYGDWPIVGAHWENGRDSMDIFGDMDMEEPDTNRWAYKEFTLYTTNDAELVAAKNISKYKFSDDGIAEAVSVSDGEKTGTVRVKIKAKREGTTVVKLEGYDTASFTLQVTANWKLSATADGQYQDAFDASTNTATIARPSGNNPSSITLQLHAKDADHEAKDFASSANTQWNDPAPSSSVPDILNSPLAVTASGDTRELSMTRLAAGPTLVTVTATYNYHDQLFQQQLFLNVAEPGIVGLASAYNGKNRFNEARVGTSNAEGNDYPYPEATRPSFNMEDNDNNLYLYASQNESILSKGSVESITIKDKDTGSTICECQDGGYTAGYDKPYFVSFSEDVSFDDRFNYRGGTIYYTGADRPSADLDVTVALKHTVSGLGEVTYTLHATVAASDVKKLQLVTLKYQPGLGGQGSTHEITLPKGSKVTLSQPSAVGINPSNGGEFQYWKDGSGVKRAAGTSLYLNEDTTLDAVWGHTIKLCNGSSDKVIGTALVVDGEAQLSGGYFKGDYETNGYTLSGWYTSPDSSGVQVLDANGNVSAGGDTAFTSGGKFHVTASTKVLYAKWIHDWSVWVPASTITDGKVYLITNTREPDSGSSAVTPSVAYASRGEAFVQSVNGTTVSRGTYLGNSGVKIEDSSIAIGGTSYPNYITSDSNPQMNQSWMWKAKTSTSYKNVAHFELQSELYPGCVLAENNCQNGNRWAVLCVLLPDDKLEGGSDTQGRRVSFSLNNNKQLHVAQPKDNGSDVWFDASSKYALYTGGTTTQGAYLYEKAEEQSEDTFNCPSITLMNGSSQVMSMSLAPSAISSIAELGTFSLPKSNGSWELQGWYASKEEDAEPVLNADGTATEGMLALSSDSVLYSKWAARPRLSLMSVLSGNSAKGTVSWEEH